MSRVLAGVGKLYRGEQEVDFPRLWRPALVASLAALLVSVASFGLRGLDFGIEFSGGTAWEVPAPGVSVADARDGLRDTGAAAAKIQIVGTDTVRVRSDIEGPEAVNEVRQALMALTGAEFNEVSVTTVGPSWGAEITRKAAWALGWFFVIVAAYIAVRLEWKMAVGALVAVIHDIVISIGFYSVFQFEITPATVIAFLTIMGYSLYDTIVVYDKVREVVGRTAATGRYTYTEMMNLALNRVLMRSVNTSITSVLPVASMLVIGSFVLGALTLQEFAVALLVGIIVGTYSSLFVAASLVAWMKERWEPNQAELARKVESRRKVETRRKVSSTRAAVSPGPASGGSSASGSAARGGSSASGPAARGGASASGASAPLRKKRKKR